MMRCGCRTIAGLLFLTAAVQAQTETVRYPKSFTILIDFNGSNGAWSRYAPLIPGRDGNLYGTTDAGGAGGGPGATPGGHGTLFRISPEGMLTTIYEFSGPDGEFPQAVLLENDDGSFWGTTPQGGSTGAGTVFRIHPTAI